MGHVRQAHVTILYLSKVDSCGLSYKHLVSITIIKLQLWLQSVCYLSATTWSFIHIVQWLFSSTGAVLLMWNSRPERQCQIPLLSAWWGCTGAFGFRHQKGGEDMVPALMEHVKCCLDINIEGGQEGGVYAMTVCPKMVAHIYWLQQHVLR